MTREPQFPRRRVTAPRSTLPAVLPPRRMETGGAHDELDDLYLRTLIRAQLRLALACAGGFVVVVAVASVLIALTPNLQTDSVFGVPWAWLLQGYGMYPVVAAFGILYVRAAARNEKRYRALRATE